jgi:gliding-associated putative ABC transporter substrate-binding component GldG
MATEEVGQKDSAQSQMDKRKRTYASNATIYTVFTIGAIVLVNLIATRVFGRLDLTQNGIYTLSPASKELAKNLPEPLTIKAYITKDLPPELMGVSRYVRDLMDEYRSASKGKIHFEAFDPSADKKYEDEANSCKVAKLQIQVMRQQKFEVSQQYLGLCLQYNGQNEAIPQITQAEGLEYMTTSLIKRMSQKKRKIAFTTGHGESDTAQGFTFLKHFIDQEYEVTSVNPGQGPIPDDIDAIVIGGPKNPFQEKDDAALKAIDAFLMKGKGAVIMLDGMSMSSPQGNMPELQGMQPKIGQANHTGLEPLLAKYGFKVGEDFVFDKKQSAPGIVDYGGRKMLASVPVFLVAEPDEIKDKDFSVLQGITALVFPFASSVDLVGPLAGGKPTAPGSRLWTLARTSPDAWKQTGFFFFSPGTKIEESKDKGSFALGYAYNGTLKSAYPSAAPPSGMSDAPAPAATPSESKKPVRLVVLGDSDFANDDYLQAARVVPVYQNGVGMLFNAINWTAEDETLTTLRTKSVTSRPLKASADDKASAVKFANVAGVPLAFIAFGIGRWRWRRVKRQQQKL